jgi:prolyl-tRNA synthetase
MLRLSSLLVRTLREDPKDAESASHRLLARAGYVRRVAPGITSWLPLGLMVLRNVEAVIREEMAAAGAQEVLLPTLLPRAPFDVSGRWDEYGPSLFRVRDRRDADHLLGPTHEEIFTLLVKNETSSYRDFPLRLFQIQTKYRDEVRARGGILRTREFLMKDSYSFDVSDEGLQASYDAHRAAYLRIFERLELDVAIVAAVSGAMGGSASEELLARSRAGEDDFVSCAVCGYAANVEAVVLTPPPRDSTAPEPAAAPRVVDTPGTPTIDALVEVLTARDDLRAPDGTWRAAHMLKNVLVRVEHPDGTTEPLAVGVPGDREIDMKRLEAALAPATVRPFGDDDFAAHPALVKGYVGPGVLGLASVSGIRYLVDPLVASGSSWVSGANDADRHVIGLVRGRDFEPDGEVAAAQVRDGDTCPRCAGPLTIDQGIEVGHVFQLGRKYAEAFDLTVPDESGAPVTVTMGSYGIGVSRVMAAIAEQHHDERGLRWPASVAPARVHLLATGKDDAVFAAAEDLATALESAGLSVLFDDRRGASAGVKFKDAELLGLPVVVVVGKRLTDGLVEVRSRRAGTSTDVALAGALDAVRALVRGT